MRVLSFRVVKIILVVLHVLLRHTLNIFKGLVSQIIGWALSKRKKITFSEIFGKEILFYERGKNIFYSVIEIKLWNTVSLIYPTG